MQIKTLELKNIGPHAHLKVEFAAGLCAIIGKNGRGKSTVLDASFAAISNEWGRFAGTKDQCIRDVAPPDEEAYVKLTGEHGDVEFEVFRRLRKAAADKGRRGGRADNELVIGDQVFTKDAEIRRELEQRIGVNFKLLSSHVFVAQRQLFAFLDQTPGERAAAFQLLCGTEKAEQLCKAIDVMLARDSDLTAEVIDNSDELNTRIGQKTRELSAAMLSLEQARIGLMPEDKIAAAKRIVRKRERCHQIDKELEALRAEFMEYAVAIKTAEEQKKQAAQALLIASSKADKLAMPANDARVALGRIKQYRDNFDRHESLQSKLKVARKKFDQLRANPALLHGRDAEHDSLLKEMAENSATASKNKEALLVLEKTGVTVCPTCGTPVKNLEKHLKQIKQTLPGLLEDINDTRDLIGLIKTARQAVQTYASTLRQAENDVKSLGTQLDLLQLSEPVQGDEASLRAMVAKWEELDAAVPPLQEKLRDAGAKWASLCGRQSGLEDRRTSLEAELEANTVADDLLSRVTLALEKHDQSRILVAAAQQAVSGVQEVLQDTYDELERLQVKLQRGRRARAFAGRLERIKEIMHRQALPQFVAQLNLQDIEEGINKVLEDFGSPFWVRAAEDLTFGVNFPGEPERSSLRLSPGLKSVLAVAFRLSLSSMFNADVGFLSLDEPSSDLDESNVRFLGDALAKYAATLHGQRQLIIVTHAQSIKNSFDHLVDLDAISA